MGGGREGWRFFFPGLIVHVFAMLIIWRLPMLKRYGFILFILPVTVVAVLYFYCNARAVEMDHLKAESDELPVDVEFHPKLGTYHYDVFWRKMRVGKAAITIERDGEYYRIIVFGKTNKKISVLYKAKYRGEAKVEPLPLVPIKAEIREQTRKKTKTIHMDFPETDRIEAVEVKEERGKETQITKREFTSETFVLDLFSTVFLVRQLDWEVGMAEVFDLFTGKKQYELQLVCDSVVNLVIGKEKREAWLILPRTRSLDGQKKVRDSGFKLYLSKDERKEVLKIEGVPKIGRIEARIRKFTPQ